jgi:hypothetical protein
MQPVGRARERDAGLSWSVGRDRVVRLRGHAATARQPSLWEGLARPSAFAAFRPKDLVWRRFGATRSSPELSGRLTAVSADDKSPLIADEGVR